MNHPLMAVLHGARRAPVIRNDGVETGKVAWRGLPAIGQRTDGGGSPCGRGGRTTKVVPSIFSGTDADADADAGFSAGRSCQTTPSFPAPVIPNSEFRIPNSSCLPNCGIARYTRGGGFDG